jgi:hypothetical protein
MRKVSGRFLVKYKLPPLEEADEFFRVYQNFKPHFPTCLVNEIQHYAYGKNDKTQLQFVYDPETKTLPNSHKQLFQDTCRFFKIDSQSRFRQWCYRTFKDGFWVSDSRIQIAVENLRFRVAALAKRHGIKPMTNKLPCQLNPCLADVVEMLRFGSIDAIFRTDRPYLAGFLTPVTGCNHLLARGSFRRQAFTSFDRFVESTAVHWKPDDLIEFLHRIDPGFMKSPGSYRLLGCVRHGPQKEDTEKALIKRLPNVDWKLVDAKVAHDVRDELASSIIGWSFGPSEATRPFVVKIIADIDAAHPRVDQELQDDLLE